MYNVENFFTYKRIKLNNKGTTCDKIMLIGATRK